MIPYHDDSAGYTIALVIDPLQAIVLDFHIARKKQEGTLALSVSDCFSRLSVTKSGITATGVRKANQRLVDDGYLEKATTPGPAGAGRPSTGFRVPEKSKVTSQPATAWIVLELDKSEPPVIDRQEFIDSILGSSVNSWTAEAIQAALKSGIEKGYLLESPDGLARGPELDKQRVYLRMLAERFGGIPSATAPHIARIYTAPVDGLPEPNPLERKGPSGETGGNNRETRSEKKPQDTELPPKEQTEETGSIEI